MFTGIVEEIGVFENVMDLGHSRRLQIKAPKSRRELKAGDSVAVDGVCLTVTELAENSFQVEAVEETLKKTTLGLRRKGDRVNLELPLRLNERLGGHILLGHVDTVGTVERLETRENSWMFYVTYPHEFSRYVIPVGSIAVNGVSLTVAERNKNAIGISIIPFTWDNTTFRYLEKGERVNIEFDVVGKYVLNMQRESDEEGRFLERTLSREREY